MIMWIIRLKDYFISTNLCSFDLDQTIIIFSRYHCQVLAGLTLNAD